MREDGGSAGKKAWHQSFAAAMAEKQSDFAARLDESQI